jgi:hypothetical protein
MKKPEVAAEIIAEDQADDADDGSVPAWKLRARERRQGTAVGQGAEQEAMAIR